MKLSYQKFWLILWCWTTQIPVKRAIVLTDLSEDAIRRWYDRFRANLPLRPETLERVVQLDEAYFKQLGLIIDKQQDTRKLAYLIFHKSPNEINRLDAVYFLQSFVRPKSKLKTDGGGIY